jgi:hypothetical protein
VSKQPNEQTLPKLNESFGSTSLKPHTEATASVRHASNRRNNANQKLFWSGNLLKLPHYWKRWVKPDEYLRLYRTVFVKTGTVFQPSAVEVFEQTTKTKSRSVAIIKHQTKKTKNCTVEMNCQRRCNCGGYSPRQNSTSSAAFWTRSQLPCQKVEARRNSDVHDAQVVPHCAINGLSLTSFLRMKSIGMRNQQWSKRTYILRP